MNEAIFKEKILTDKQKAVEAYYWITQENIQPNGFFETPIVKCKGCGEILQKYHPAIEWNEAWINLKNHLSKTGFNNQHQYLVNLNQF